MHASIHYYFLSLESHSTFGLSIIIHVDCVNDAYVGPRNRTVDEHCGI
jgi:hypothetical protein